MSPISLQHRLNRRLVTGITALLVVFAASLGGLLVRGLVQEFDRSLASKARAAVDLTRRQLDRAIYADAFSLAFENNDRPTYFALRLSDGTVLQQSHARKPLKASTGQESSDTLRFADVTLPNGRAGRQVEIDFVPRQTSGRLLLPREVPVGAEIQVATLIVAEPRSALYWNIARAGLTLFGFCALLLLALTLLVRNALRHGLEPIVGLKRQLEILDTDHVTQRVNLANPPRELVPVLQGINRLLRRVEHASQQEQQLSRDMVQTG